MYRRFISAALSLAVGAAVVGCSHSGMSDHDHSDLTTIQLNDAPGAVQSAVRRDYPGAKIDYVGKHELGDHTHYHVELTTADGKTVYRTYSPAGENMNDAH